MSDEHRSTLHTVAELIRTDADDQRQDGIYNPNTGLNQRGVDRGADLRVQSGTFLSSQDLEALWVCNWLATRIVQLVVDESLLRGFSIDGVDDQKAVQKRWMQLNYAKYREGALQRSHYQARLHGGGGLYIGTKGPSGTTTSPLPDDFEIGFLETFHAFTLDAETRYEGKNDANFRMPKIYKTTGTFRKDLRFHETRFLRTIGVPPMGINQKAENSDAHPEWGISVLQPVFNELSRYDLSWAALSNLLQESSIPIFTIKGLAASVARKGIQFIRDRFTLFNTGRSLLKSVVLEEGEEYRRESVSFADLPGVFQQLVISVSAAAGIPVTKLFKQSPAGMNATGQSDLEQWNDTVNVYRELCLRPQLEQLIGAMEKRDVQITFPPMSMPSEKDRAATRLVNAQGDRAYWEMEAMDTKTLVAARAEGKNPEDTELWAKGPPEKEKPPSPPPVVVPMLPPTPEPVEEGDEDGDEGNDGQS